MRVTAIWAKTQRKRLDRSAHRAEKRRCRARMLRVHSMIRRVPSVWATTDTAQGEKCLFNCSIPAHCIDVRRLPLFIARSALRDLIAGLHADAKGVQAA